MGLALEGGQFQFGPQEIERGGCAVEPRDAGLDDNRAQRCAACREMPSPVLALPCGSRSMISTLSPTAASAVPRLMAVVVLPTPPFWLAMARMRATAGSADWL